MVYRIILVGLFSIFFLHGGFGQIDEFYEITKLPKKVKESSGLIFFDGILITHNDSGDDAVLYQLDQVSGEIIKEIKLVNGGHRDWEDIAQDSDYIYIGDIGNNYGNRTDLVIYRVSKQDVINLEEVYAERILLEYEDQIDFSDQHHSNDFDAEGMVVTGDSIVVFTKNWRSDGTNVYILSKSIGSHRARKVGHIGTAGLVTGATIDKLTNDVILCGYQSGLNPFLIKLKAYTFNPYYNTNLITFISLMSEMGNGSQVEGVTLSEEGRYFLSREKFKTTISGIEYKFDQKLYKFRLVNSVGLDILSQGVNSCYFDPINQVIKIECINTEFKVNLYSLSGQLHSSSYCRDKDIDVQVQDMAPGLYIVTLLDGENLFDSRKIFLY